MLDAFFNMEYTGNTWFEGLRILDHPEFDGYRNAYPVIDLNLKDVQAEPYDGFLDGIRSAVLRCYRNHDYLFKQKDVAEELSYISDTLTTRTTPETPLVESIRLLISALARYHDRRVVVLINEYDSAVASTSDRDSRGRKLAFLRDILGSALKDTGDVQMACITGITQIAEESVFSGFNNVCVYDIFSEEFSDRFGFTETEVKEILNHFGHPEKRAEAKEWYGGYRFGNADVYNPFSIMMYVLNDFKTDRYWTVAGPEMAIEQLLDTGDDRNLEQILPLMNGGEISSKLKATSSFSDIGRDRNALYSIMTASGYLRAVPCDDDTFCISIPNMEIEGLLDKLLKEENKTPTA